ncbi:hypothetical protein HDV63DRAFT_172720 [Trichoderma sp. SZMC 28014]
MRDGGRRRDGLDLQLPGRRVDYCVSAAIAVGHAVAGGWACRGGDWLERGQVKCATPSLAGATLRRSSLGDRTPRQGKRGLPFIIAAGRKPGCIRADRVLTLLLSLLSACFLLFYSGQLVVQLRVLVLHAQLTNTSSRR